MQVDSFFKNLLRLDPNKAIARRNAFSTFPNAWNGVELEDEVESEELKCQFSQVEENLNLQRSLNRFPFQTKKTPKKKMIVMKDKNEKIEKIGKKIHCV